MQAGKDEYAPYADAYYTIQKRVDCENEKIVFG
jgi:hypothetical protein